MIEKKWTYQGEDYSSIYAVRQAIWEKERKAFGSPEDAEAWAELGVTYTETEVADPEPDENQLRWQVIRERDQKLSESDYYVLSDYPSTEEGLDAVKTYRQALRDITAQEGFPKEVEWPGKPDVLKG